MREARKLYTQKVESRFQSKPAEAWSGLKSVLRMNDSCSRCNLPANDLNVFYNRFSKDIDVPILPPVDTSVNEFFDHHTVRRSLKSVNCRKSSGLDGISPKLLKFCADSIVQTVTQLFNASLQYGIFLDIWKQARNTPLRKCKGASDVKDFNPCSITSIVRT